MQLDLPQCAWAELACRKAQLCELKHKEKFLPKTDPNKKVVVTYSSINGNGFGGWGEVVMGSKGTLILDKETDVLLYRNSDTSSKVGVAKQGGNYVLDTSASGDYAAVSGGFCRCLLVIPALSRGHGAAYE